MRAAPAFLSILLAVGAVPAFAQSVDVLRVRAVRHDTIVAASTVTATFTVANTSGDIVHVRPLLRTPPDWPLLLGTTPFAIAPRDSTILMVSVVVPARAMAGDYAVVVAASTHAIDSVIVRVPQRRALEVALLDRPGYVVSGESYSAHFQVRNRGNHVTRVRLRARSTLGRAQLTDREVRLLAGSDTIVEMRVASPAGLAAATDDVLELSAVEDSVTEAQVASTRVTVVPEPSRAIEEYLRIPTQVSLRAASSDAVSPFEVHGRGRIIDGGETNVDFLFRGPTGPFAAFGERDEYRLTLTAPAWRARFGDQIYMLSPLTAAGQPGFGAGLDGSRGIIRAGAHGQRFRRSIVDASEIAGFIGVGRGSGARIDLNAAHRDGGILPGDVGSARVAYTGPVAAEAEVARSKSDGASGTAQWFRVSHAGDRYSIDFGHDQAEPDFGGAQRGSRHSHLIATTQWNEQLSFALTGGSHRVDLTRTTGIPYIDWLDVGTLGSTLLGRYTLELSGVRRANSIAGLEQHGAQQGVRIRADHDTWFAHFALEAEGGRARDLMGLRRTFTDISLSARRSLPAGYFSIWTERYSGGSITRGADGTLTIGGDASRRIGAGGGLNVSLIGYATRATTADASWQSQLDVMISRALRSGSRITLRARLMGGRSLSPSQQSVAYLEYGIPLRLPVSRLRTPGRVYGRVVDAVSGHGVPGALVRLGPQVAITDADGEVRFGGVPAGEHRLSMSQETSFADAVFVGDPTIRVDSARSRPTTFTLAIAQSARLDIDVRRFAAVRTAMAGVTDSLADAGGISNAMLVLAGDRDTLYRTTLVDGSATFTDVPPGRWVLFVRGDAPAFHRFDPDRLELTLAPGENRHIAFRLVPRKREVQLIGEDKELRSEPTTQGSTREPTGAAPRTRKPDENRPLQDR